MTHARPAGTRRPRGPRPAGGWPRRPRPGRRGEPRSCCTRTGPGRRACAGARAGARALRAQAPALEFVVDGRRAIVRVVDRETGEVLREIPPREAIAASRAIEHMQGLLIRLKA
ncbi:MAG: flagellar protein FlaG [Burkholderiales bacterium]|nr:flagellar protein FlaG [Burkholderiales bacterium]